VCVDLPALPLAGRLQASAARLSHAPSCACAAGTFSDRPQSPRSTAAATGAAAPAAVALPQQPVRASGYVPPHLRGNPAAAAASTGERSAPAGAPPGAPPGAGSEPLLARTHWRSFMIPSQPQTNLKRSPHFYLQPRSAWRET
jgi:hypothetical protein